MPDNNAHALRFRAEWEVLQDIVIFDLHIRIDKLDAVIISIYKLHVKLLSKLHQRNFIGA